MIDPTTLRVGNVIKVKDQGKWHTAAVVSTFPSWIIAKNQYTKIGGCYDANELHGAYLSDDWLIENGWKPAAYQPYANSEVFVLCFTNEKTKDVSLKMTNDTFQFKVKGNDMLTPFKTMHEFQNQFYQITQQEILTNASLKATLALAQTVQEIHGNE
jgi:hypothetical protein